MAKAYLCNQCLLCFPDWPAEYWGWLTRMVLLFFQYTFLPTSMWRQIFVSGWAAFRVATSSSGGSGSFSPLGPSRGGPPGIFLFFSMPALFHFGNSPATGGLGVECLQPSLEFSGKLSVLPLALVPLILHFTLSLCQQGFSSFVCQAVAGATQTSTSRVYQQCWKEWAGWCAWQGLPNNAISAPKLANFFLYLLQVGLAWHTIGISCSAISAFWSLLAFTGHLIILSFWN